MTTKHENHELKAGRHLILTLTNNQTGKIVLKEEHEIIESPENKQAQTDSDTASAQHQLQTRLVSQEWSDPELQQLNSASEDTQLKAGAADAAKFGLDVAKFAWDVIKSNEAVVDAKATTTSVLYKHTDGLDYKNSQRGRTGSYTLSVHDSLIKSWELIHADIVCEGTFHASPGKEGIPDGYYLPAINVYAKTAHADLPCQLSATATLSNVSNMGDGNLDPMVTILNSLDFGWLFQKRHLTLKFTASGSQGFHMAA